VPGRMRAARFAGRATIFDRKAWFNRTGPFVFWAQKYVLETGSKGFKFSLGEER